MLVTMLYKLSPTSAINIDLPSHINLSKRKSRNFKSIYDELRKILSAQTTQEGNPIVLYLAKFMTSSSIVVQRESVGCLAELAQVRKATFSEFIWTIIIRQTEK